MLKNFCRPFCLFIEVDLRFPGPICLLSNPIKALDGPLINQSNHLFLSGYTINSYIEFIFGTEVVWSDKHQPHTVLLL